MTPSQKPRNPVAAKTIDPVFAAIAEHKAAIKKMYRLHGKFDEAESEARKTHGKRPEQMILWRGCDAFSENGIDYRREEFLSQPGADREKIEKEYLDAKARLAAAKRASAEWDERAGTAPLREQYESADLAKRKAVMRMARTKPGTLTGAAALIDYARRDIDIGQSVTGWPTLALKTVSVALSRMNAEAALPGAYRNRRAKRPR